MGAGNNCFCFFNNFGPKG